MAQLRLYVEDRDVLDPIPFPGKRLNPISRIGHWAPIAMVELDSVVVGVEATLDSMSHKLADLRAMLGEHDDDRPRAA